MGLGIFLLFVGGAIFSEYVLAEDKTNDAHLNRMGQLEEIPRNFEVHGHNARVAFRKYVNEIQRLTAGKNLTAVYKVKVELIKPDNVHKKKKLMKKNKPKKFNVPLKKQNMKLSNFEVLLRKLFEENGQRVKLYEQTNSELFTANITDQPPTTKQIILKYKPIISRVRTNFSKVIKPVRTKEIVLSV